MGDASRDVDYEVDDTVDIEEWDEGWQTKWVFVVVGGLVILAVTLGFIAAIALFA